MSFFFECIHNIETACCFLVNIIHGVDFTDQLKGKLNLNVDDMDKLTVDDLRSQVDYAISQVIVYN